MSSVSFFQKNPITCPVCKEEFKREVLRSGRGRIIADDLESDLRRTYKVTEKFGKVNPLIYNIVVCPACFYAAMPGDFLELKDSGAINAIANGSQKRKKYADQFYGDLNFHDERVLETGAASYFLAISSYTHFPPEFAPTTKQAICAIRASWLCEDLYRKSKENGYDRAYWYFRYLAWKKYEKAIKTAETGEETFDNVKKLGPDLDTDYGYTGALYMLAYLGYEFKDTLKEEEALEKFKYYRASMAKVFGFGKSSKEKPGPLLNVARDVHKAIGKVIQKIENKNAG